MERTIQQPDDAPIKPSTFKRYWDKWLAFAKIIGTIQMVIILTIMFWVIFPIMAIPFKLLADPLANRGAHKARWIKRDPVDDVLSTMKNQF